MNDLQDLSEKFLTEYDLEKIKDFQCQDVSQVDAFLKEEAFNLMDRNLVRTRLFFDENQNLVGFYSLFNDTIKMNKQKRLEMDILLPDGVAVIPAIRLHYLGVDKRYRGKGYGVYLMASVLYYCTYIARITGCSLITIESTKEARGFYEKFGFSYICPTGAFDLMSLNTKSLFNIFKSSDLKQAM